MAIGISSLPPEVLHQILGYLPITSLLAFGQTCKYHQELRVHAFQKLRIGVHPTRIHGLLSLFDSLDETQRDAAQSIQITLDRKRNRTKEVVIRNQNRKITQVLRSQGRRLRDLEVSLWALEESTARAITSLPQLRHLSIRMDHPHTRHRDLPVGFWKTSAPSTLWNMFSSPPRDPPTPVFGRLISLTLERAGITTFQLRRILEENRTTLRELRLRKCLTLGADFWTYLAASPLAAQLDVFHFTQSNHPEIDEKILPLVKKFTNLESFSLQGCSGIADDEIRRLNKEVWHFAICIVSENTIPGGLVEVDPAYK